MFSELICDAGFSSTIIRLPHDNLGIAVVTNAETGETLSSGYIIAQATTYRLLDEALGLEPIQDWKDRSGPITVQVEHLTDISGS
jgi:hypothetical protein